MTRLAKRKADEEVNKQLETQRPSKKNKTIGNTAATRRRQTIGKKNEVTATAKDVADSPNTRSCSRQAAVSVPDSTTEKLSASEVPEPMSGVVQSETKPPQTTTPDKETQPKGVLDTVGDHLNRGWNYVRNQLAMDPITTPTLTQQSPSSEKDLDQTSADAVTGSISDLPVEEPHQTCSTCLDHLPTALFPTLTDHSHTPDICQTCLQEWISTHVTDWTKDIKCPSATCDCALHQSDLFGAIDADIYDTFLDATLRRAITHLPDYHACLRPSCASGGFVSPATNIAICDTCSFRMCTVHNMAFHDGQACAEYDAARSTAGKEEAASLKTISENTMKCPKCSYNVEKKGGCDHMTCRCRAEFCYQCGASYQGASGIRSLGNTAHKPLCKYHNERLPSYATPHGRPVVAPPSLGRAFVLLDPDERAVRRDDTERE